MVSVIIPFNVNRGHLADALASFHIAQAAMLHDVDDVGVEPKLILSRNANKTFAQNFNEGLEQVDTEFVCFLAEDDELTEQSLTARALYLTDSDADAVCANAEFIGDVPPWHPTEYKSKPTIYASVLATHNSIHGGTMMYRTEVIKGLGGMDESLITGEEWELNCRLLYKGYFIGYLDAMVYRNRIWSGSKSGQGSGKPKGFNDKWDRRVYLDKIAARYK